MAQYKKCVRYSKRERGRKHLYYLENRIYRMIHGEDKEGYFRWKFIRTEDPFENEEQLEPFQEEILEEARQEIQDELNNNQEGRANNNVY